MTSQAAVNITDRKEDLSHWVPAYTFVIMLFGVGILGWAVAHPPQDLLGLFLFAVLAAVCELSNVELFRSSHANVSISLIIAIASILALGPFGAVFVQTVGGVTTGVKIALGQKQERASSRASWLRQSSFNVGMFVTAAFAAGWVYVLSGGTLGRIVFSSDLLPLLLAVSTYVIVNLALLLGVGL